MRRLSPSPILFALLHVPCVACGIQFGSYYPEMGSNGQTWRPGDGTTDTDTDADTDGTQDTDPGDTDPGDTDPGTTGGDTDATAGAVIIEMNPGDTPPCASGDPYETALLEVYNDLGHPVDVYGVDDACVETFASRAPPGQSTFFLSPVGSARVVRVPDTGEPLYAVVVTDDVLLVVQ